MAKIDVTFCEDCELWIQLAKTEQGVLKTNREIGICNKPYEAAVYRCHDDFCSYARPNFRHMEEKV